MYNCRFCGVVTKGINFLDENGYEYVPDLCSNCLEEMSWEIEEEEEDLLFCKKCSSKVTILRGNECISCYDERCDLILKMPMEIPEHPPLGGYAYPSQKLRILSDYAIISCKWPGGREC